MTWIFKVFDVYIILFSMIILLVMYLFFPLGIALLIIFIALGCVLWGYWTNSKELRISGKVMDKKSYYSESYRHFCGLFYRVSIFSPVYGKVIIQEISPGYPERLFGSTSKILDSLEIGLNYDLVFKHWETMFGIYNLLVEVKKMP